MALISTGLVEFRESVARHIKELERSEFDRYSTEWFFLRYLKRVARQAEQVGLAREISGMSGLTRYYVDRIEAGSDLATRFEEILDAHRHALRMEHGS